MEFVNSYDDLRRAEAYARLEFARTYYLAFRDLPAILAGEVRGRSALDLGCGAGRSTRFLRRGGFAVIGADIAPDMIRMAREADPGGDYRRIREADLSALESASFDLILAAFTFDNIPTAEKKVGLLRECRRRLLPAGRIVLIVSSPDIYLHEWASFSTRDFPENRRARSGDTVRIVITDLEDPRPVEDVLWTEESYREVFAAAGLSSIAVHRPRAEGTEPYAWVNETRIAPWHIHVLASAADRGSSQVDL